MSERVGTITVDAAEGYLYGDALAEQEVSKHRWYTKTLIVFRADDGSLRGFYYDAPATEEQEGMDTFEADPVPVYAVTAKEITTTVYEVAA